jgi:hypothetical protein
MKSFRQRLLRVVFGVMRPFARLMLNAGLGYKDFAEVAKLAFVEVALNHYGLRGRTTNVSRIAVMTGINRRHVAQLRQQLASMNEDDFAIGMIPSDILHYWHQDPEYVSREGNPIAIAFEGPRPSFSELVKKYAGDVPAGAMRSELKRVGAIIETPSGTLKPIKSYFIPTDLDEKRLLALRHSVRALLSTVAFNSVVAEQGSGRVERFVYSENLSLPQIERLRASIRRNVERYTEELDDEFAQMELTNIEHSIAPCGRTVAVGVYYFEDDGPIDQT